MRLAFNPKFQAFDANGDPLSGGKLYTYEAGTVTEKTTYADSGKLANNTNPIVLDSRGESANPIFLEGKYKFILKTSADVVIWTVDDIEGSDFNQIAYASTALNTAVTDAGANNTTILVDQPVTLTGNLTVPANVDLWITRAGVITLGNYNLTINGTLSAGLYKIFNCSGTGAVTFGTRVHEVYPEWWGATAGSDTVDSGPAIQAAMDSVTDGTVKLALGAYYIAAPLKFTASLIGSGGSKTWINAKATWSGTEMLDFYVDGTFREHFTIRGIGWDADSLASNHFAQSLETGGGHAKHLFEDCRFVGATQFSITANSASASAFTGTVWINCDWVTNGSALNLGLSQDDITFINCRFDVSGGVYDQPFNLFGVNISMIGCYVYFEDLYNSAGVKAVFDIGSRPCAIRNMFLETNDSDITHVFKCSWDVVTLTLDNMILRINDTSQSPSLVALVYSEVESHAASNRMPAIALRNIYADSDNPTWKLLDLYVGSTSGNNDYITMTIDGCDGFELPLFQWYAGSSTVTRDTVVIHGNHRGARWGHSFHQTLGTTYPRTQPAFTSHRGISTYISTADSASGTSPRTSSVTLPSEGQWLVSVTALVNTSYDHMMSSLWLVDYYDATNDLLTVQEIGAHQESAGSAYTLDDLTLGAPSDAGVCTATATWTAGGSYVVRFVFRCRKLSNYTLDYDY